MLYKSQLGNLGSRTYTIDDAISNIGITLEGFRSILDRDPQSPLKIIILSMLKEMVNAGKIKLNTIHFILMDEFSMKYFGKPLSSYIIEDVVYTGVT